MQKILYLLLLLWFLVVSVFRADCWRGKIPSSVFINEQWQQTGFCRHVSHVGIGIPPPLLLLHSSLSLYFAIFTWLPNNRRWIFSSVPSNRPHKRVIWRVFVSDMREKHVWSQRKIKTCADLARHLFLLVSSVFVSSQGSSRSGRGAVTFSYSEDDSIGINSACNFMPVFLAWMCDNWSTKQQSPAFIPRQSVAFLELSQ